MQTGEPTSLFSIIASVQNDIRNLRTQLENIPPFPKGNLPTLLRSVVQIRDHLLLWLNFRTTWGR